MRRDLFPDRHQARCLRVRSLWWRGGSGPGPGIVKAGRDHWPACYSALLAGAGIKGGQVYGASDKNGAYVRDNPVSPESFGATLLRALGVPAESRLSPDGFTRPASTGTPVTALLE